MRLLGALFCGLALPCLAVADEKSKPTFVFVDIQPQGNRLLSDKQGSFDENNLASVPQGEQVLGGTSFKVGEKMIQLRGEKEPGLPEKAEGIRVDAAFDRLHILHSTGHGEGMGMQEDGSEIGAYVIHYADDTDTRIPIVYGEDVRDWWDWPDRPNVTRAKEAWTGTNPASAMFQRKIRLYSVAWTNPHPEKKVTSIDFVSLNTRCDPFLVALTVEKAK